MIRGNRRARVVITAMLALLAGAAVVVVLATVGGGPSEDKKTTIVKTVTASDRDGDGFSDEVDKCPSTPGRGPPPGCVPDRNSGDRDGDGVPDSKDDCPDTPARTDNGCPPEEAVTGLTELEDKGALRYDTADTGTARISGRRSFNDAIWGRLAGQSSSPFSDFTLVAEARFDRVRGWVGIKSDAECPENGALVSIRDDQGVLIWKPKGPVTIRRRVHFDEAIRGARQLRFTNKLAQAPDPDASLNTCEDSITEPAWGEVELVSSGG